MDINQTRKLYPITRQYIYFNHAAVSPLSTRVLAEMNKHLVDCHQNGLLNFESWVQRQEEVRELAARLIGAEVEEMAFVRNTSHGLIIVANGIDWHEGDNIVTAEGEFTANVYPWVYLSRLGVETRFAPCRDGRILVDDIFAQIDERTRLLALSFVEFGTGFRNDLATIGRMCREKGIYFCVDAIQGLGALQLNVRDCQIDFLTAGANKWLLGPMGIGIFYCRQELVEQLVPALIGWLSVVHSEDFYRYDSSLKTDARRFEEATPNVVGIYGLGAALETFLEVGLSEIEEHILAITDYLIQGLKAKGYQVTSPHQSRDERSGIVCFNHPDHELDRLEQLLTEAKIIISKRGDIIRVAPHFYNTKDEIDHLLEVLP
ncbi:MAG: aminotransferase class V-fold PLP-dependent enzyme [Anaerolineae bacterium]